MSRKKSKNKLGVSGNKKSLAVRQRPSVGKRPRRGGLPVDNAPPPIESLKQVNLNAAGIDIASNVHFVAVPKDRDSENPVRSFGAFTADLEAIADWLAQCGIETVAMESTGVYWIPLFELLDSRGFQVILVEPSQIKKYRRKTDVLDCQWIQTLHTFGLLTGSFRPADQIIVLRSYMRQREMLVKSAAQHIQHMQKAMEQMNLKLSEVVSDILGVTGMSIIDAILAGQRDPEKLAKLRNEKCKNDEATIALALHGNWREEHLFSLRQALDLYRYYHKKIVEVDDQIEVYMSQFEDRSGGEPLAKPPRAKQRSKTANEPKFDTRRLLYEMLGVDLTTIDGMGPHSVLQIVSEIGINVDAFPTEKHFVSWLSLCPEANKSGGKKQKKGKSPTHRSSNRVAQTLRVCAQTLIQSKCALGAFGRRLRGRDGAASAITAIARKLAIIVYTMIKTGRAYMDIGADAYNGRFKEKLVATLRRRACDLGYDLMASDAA
ncbi:IS110 family RNA-guided transposase [Novipirellula artificiosorum]|uniref:Transposase n=1 Tax=Novipirellula artificiosorum TaxID=2528016 RepID=A0A5C6E0V1_9BACT|nr:IS110 family transposase [Novipirellula artificiosorum]TWU40799.1 Transposase [Novipirellula artificiosorum]